jgi:CheY-like chemotaxis protein
MENNDPTFSDAQTVDFSKLIDSIPGQAYWTDPHCIIKGCNDLQAKSLGFHSKEELIDRTGYALVWQELNDRERERLAQINTGLDKQVMSSGVANTREEWMITVEGPKKYLINKIPLKNNEHQIIGLLSIATEITQPKRTTRKKMYSLGGGLLIQQEIALNDPDNPPLKILLVEDNDIASKTAKGLLKNFYHEVDTAANSTEAITHFEPYKYDLIFTSVGLPDLDGYRLTEQLRKIENNAQADPTPIIALTAHESALISKKAIASGIDAILTKPLSHTDALKAMNQFVYHEKIHTSTQLKSNKPPVGLANRFIKKAIDLEEGATILGKDQTAALDMLVDLVNSFSEVRTSIEKAYRANNLKKLSAVIHKFYGGLCYVGVPHLRQALKELETALITQEKTQFNRLYQRMLDEMSAVEREFENSKVIL